MRVRLTYLVPLLVTGCQFDGTGLSSAREDAGDIGSSPVDGTSIDAPSAVADAPSGPADAPLPVDAPAPIADDVIHVPRAGEFAGAGHLVLSGAMRIDTRDLNLGGRPMPAGVVFDVWAHDGGGRDLAVLHVASLEVTADADVRIVGTRPLVIIAGTTATVAGILDAGARQTEPGAGGLGATQGTRRGGNAADVPVIERDGGGGGAGGATAGAAGGPGCSRAGCIDGGKGGVIYTPAELTRLDGGAGGGAAARGGNCGMRIAGAGGGAVQIYAAASIRVTGVIDVGGGGGAGGNHCDNDAASGAGGGAGGAIFLQAPTVTITGALVANGGAGGGAGTVSADGGDGANGRRDAKPADGGGPGAPQVGAGGAGGALGIVPGAGAPGVFDGGGGGGAAGSIIARGKAMPSANGATVSPAADLGTY